MKKILKSITFSLILLTSTFVLIGCDFENNPPEPKDYNADIQVVAKEDITLEHFVKDDNTTYYTSPGFSLTMSVRGHFMIMDYFSLDGNKRIYDNLYFYENDYFYIVTDDYNDLYASLAEESDKQYAVEEKESGYDIQLNIIQSGVYKLIFDTETLKFDIVYKAEITTPKYYTIKNCDIYSIATNWVEMAVNPNNNEEFYVSNFHIDTGKAIRFFSHIHTSNYIPTLEETSTKYATSRKEEIKIIIGGDYNVYINSKTYEVRLELINTETADYTCIYHNGSEFITLQKETANIPYIFTFQLEVTTQYTTNIPKFYNAHYSEYTLNVTNSPDVMQGSSSYYFKKIGTYNITINLKTFELTAELLPE